MTVSFLTWSTSKEVLERSLGDDSEFVIGGREGFNRVKEVILTTTSLTWRDAIDEEECSGMRTEKQIPHLYTIPLHSILKGRSSFSHLRS